MPQSHEPAHGSMKPRDRRKLYIAIVLYTRQHSKAPIEATIAFSPNRQRLMVRTMTELTTDPRRTRLAFNAATLQHSVVFALAAALFCGPVAPRVEAAPTRSHAARAATANPVTYRTVMVDSLAIFYREAGDPRNPTILLLHGFPSSSSQYRDLIPLLADRYHVVAPDYPGFGHSAQPDRAAYRYSFDRFYETIDHFTKAVGIERFVLYGQDYGAPVGLRFALRQPERLRALIIQNGNAYEAGFTPLWEPIKALWANDTPETRRAVSTFLTRDGAMFEHSDGMPTDRLNPDTVDLDAMVFDRPGNRDVQLDLFADYRSNVALYPAIHAAFRAHRFPTLVIWGRKDPSFGVAGAEAFRADLPDAEIHVLDDAGHFAAETHPAEVAGYIRSFLPRALARRP